MAIQNYRLDIEVPQTKVKSPFSLSLSPTSGNVLRIETELKRDKGKISYLTARIYDKGQSILSSLPDIAFFTLPCKLYLSKPGDPLSVSTLVFDGKVTQLSMGYPGPESLTIVAHDNSIDARKNKTYKTFKNLNSVQLAKKIALSYGFEVDASELGDVVLAQKTLHFGPEIDDYNLIGRALAADGLELYISGKKIRVRQSATKPYQVTFKRGQVPVLSFEAVINHVSSGTSGNKTGIDYGLQGNQAKALIAASQTQNFNFDTALAALAGAEDKTHRIIPAGTLKSNTGSHGEEVIVKNWTNKITQLRRRKDTATLTLTAIPDITLENVINIEGWGSKLDHTWWIDSIKHTIAGGDGSPATTMLALTGPPSKAAARQGIDGGASLADIDSIKHH